MKTVRRNAQRESTDLPAHQPTTAPVTPEEKNKTELNSVALRLSNNMISSLAGLPEALEHTFDKAVRACVSIAVLICTRIFQTQQSCHVSTIVGCYVCTYYISALARSSGGN